MKKILACLIMFGLFFWVPVFCAKKTINVKEQKESQIVKAPGESNKIKQLLSKKWHDELESRLQKLQVFFDKEETSKKIQDFIFAVCFCDVSKKAIKEMFVDMEAILTQQMISKETLKYGIEKRIEPLLVRELSARVHSPEDFLKRVFAEYCTDFFRSMACDFCFFYDFREALSFVVSLISGFWLEVARSLQEEE